MSTKDVKTLLLLNSSSADSSFSFLFHCARYWAQQGSRVLFISKTPLRRLPFSVGKTNVPLNPDAFKLIQFMYLVNWQELIQQLYSIHLRHNPVSVIIIKSLESYFDTAIPNHEDHSSLICGSLFYAASLCARITSQPAVLISDYVSTNSTIERNIIKSFFHNVWEIKNTRESTIKLSKLSPSDNDEIIAYTFNKNMNDSNLMLIEVIKKIVHNC